MKRISPLSEQLANQIAAGEVIERPSSVVKELLENSLDAGADRIDIRILGGGTQGIQVTDNGAGIHRDDLILAVKPHATSKIDTVSDLDVLTTMGFRGEALASISSVSRFQIASRLHHEEQAWCLQVGLDENDFKVLPCSGTPGTVIEVKELFYNTPARRRFLRADKTEFAHIENVVKRFVMGAFHLTVSLFHNDRLVRRYFAVQNPELERRRLNDIFGKAFAEGAAAVNFHAGQYHLHGWLCPSTYHRSSSDGQYFYINQRVVRDKFLNHAVKEAFGDRIPVGRFPCYALFLEMPPEELDVNVHPMKSEVRFRRARDVHDMVVQGLSSSLQRHRPYEAQVPKSLFRVQERQEKQKFASGSNPDISRMEMNNFTEPGELFSKLSHASENFSDEALASLLTSKSRDSNRNGVLETLHESDASHTHQKLEANPDRKLSSQSRHMKGFALHWLGAYYFWYHQATQAGIIDAQAAILSFLIKRWQPKTRLIELEKPFLLPLSYDFDPRSQEMNFAEWELEKSLGNWGIKAKMNKDKLMITAAPLFFKSWTLPFDYFLEFMEEKHWQVNQVNIEKFCLLVIQKQLLIEPEKLETVLQECLESIKQPYPREWFRRADSNTIAEWFQSE